jgi:hypothetical protein
MTLHTILIIGLIATLSTPLASSAMTLPDGTVEDRNTTVISDRNPGGPMRTDTIGSSTGGQMIIFRDDGTTDDRVVNGTHIKKAIITMRRDMQNMGSGGQMSSGATMENETKWLMLAIRALSPADRATLMKMVRDYLVSKGIDPTKYAEERDEINEIRQDGHDDIMDMRKRNQEAMKAKRDEMRARIREVRENSRVSVQDISMTR